MIISWEGKDNFVIKTKGKTVKMGSEILLGDFKITTPGEYELGGIQIEVVDGIIELISEKMTIAWVKKAKVLSDEELEKLNIDVLLIGVGGGEFTETKVATEVVGQIDPKIVIPMYSENLEGFAKEEGVDTAGQDQFKFTYNDLPVEGRKIVVLNP